MSSNDLAHLKSIVDEVFKARAVLDAEGKVRTLCVALPPRLEKRKLEVIKAIRRATGLGLREAADLVNAGGDVVQIDSEAFKELEELFLGDK